MAEMNAQDQQIGATSKIKVTIAKDSMSATVFLRPLKSDEQDITVDDILSELENSEVVFGIDRNAVEKIVKDKIFNQPVKVASGKIPERGRPAEFQYHFDTSQDHKPKEDERGNIDYKNINFIQNVAKGDILAIKIPPTPGQPGMTIRGKELMGANGRDIPFKCGANTSISKDGLTLTATCDGAIVFTHNKISVNDVMIIPGDIDFSTGNIDCSGSVRINGSVKAGFEIKTNGDVEIGGNVENAKIYAKGNIMIKGGIIGKEDGEIVADGDITFKFAEGMRIVSNSNVIAGDEIVGCNISAKDEIIVKSRVGKIIGGELKTRKLIRANQIGSEAGTTTVIRVAHDVNLMIRYNNVVKEITRLKEDEVKIKEALGNLYRLQMDKKLTVEQENVLQKFEDFKEGLPEALENLNKEKQEIELALAELLDARIIVESKLYSGVKAYFGIVYLDIIEDREICELSCDGSRVHVSAYKKER